MSETHTDLLVRLAAAESELSDIVRGFTPWLDMSDAKRLVPLLREAREAIGSERDRFMLAVVNAPSLDESGYLCEKAAILRALVPSSPTHPTT